MQVGPALGLADLAGHGIGRLLVVVRLIGAEHAHEGVRRRRAAASAPGPRAVARPGRAGSARTASRIGIRPRMIRACRAGMPSPAPAAADRRPARAAPSTICSSVPSRLDEVAALLERGAVGGGADLDRRPASPSAAGSAGGSGDAAGQRGQGRRRARPRAGSPARPRRCRRARTGPRRGRAGPAPSPGALRKYALTPQRRLAVRRPARLRPAPARPGRPAPRRRRRLRRNSRSTTTSVPAAARKLPSGRRTRGQQVGHAGQMPAGGGVGLVQGPAAGDEGGEPARPQQLQRCGR